jgi:uncharacterized repeat protein (TIGR03917 family)
MSIFASPDDPRHPAPSDLLAVCPRASTRCTGPDAYEVTVRPRAGLADVIDVLGVIPIDTVFVRVFGDGTGETVLVFRQIPPDDAPAAACLGDPDAPPPAATELVAA